MEIWIPDLLRDEKMLNKIFGEWVYKAKAKLKEIVEIDTSIDFNLGIRERAIEEVKELENYINFIIVEVERKVISTLYYTKIKVTNELTLEWTPDCKFKIKANNGVDLIYNYKEDRYTNSIERTFEDLDEMFAFEDEVISEIKRNFKKMMKNLKKLKKEKEKVNIIVSE